MSGVLNSISGLSPSAFSRRAVVSYLRKYVHEVLVNRLEGLSQPRKSMDRLTDRPDMTLVVDRGRKTTIQQQVFSPYTISESKTCKTMILIQEEMDLYTLLNPILFILPHWTTILMLL